LFVLFFYDGDYLYALPWSQHFATIKYEGVHKSSRTESITK